MDPSLLPGGLPAHLQQPQMVPANHLQGVAPGQPRPVRFAEPDPPSDPADPSSGPSGPSAMEEDDPSTVPQPSTSSSSSSSHAIGFPPSSVRVMPEAVGVGGLSDEALREIGEEVTFRYSTDDIEWPC